MDNAKKERKLTTIPGVRYYVECDDGRVDLPITEDRFLTVINQHM